MYSFKNVFALADRFALIPRNLVRKLCTIMITCKWALRNFRYIGKYLIVLSTILQLESGKGHNIDFDPSLTILQIYSQQQ